MNTENEFKNIFQGDYVNEVVQSYFAHKHSQFTEALTTVVIKEDIGMPSLVKKFLSDKPNFDYIQNIIGGNNIERVLERVYKEKDSRENKLVQYLVEYGKTHDVDAEKVVEAPEALNFAITKAYGSIDTYKEEVKGKVVDLHKTVGIIKSLDSRLNTIVLAGLRLTKPTLYKKVKPVINWIKKHADKVAEFGQEVIKEYALIRAREIDSLLGE